MWRHVHRSIPLDICSQNINIKTVAYYTQCPTHAQPMNNLEVFFIRLQTPFEHL